MVCKKARNALVVGTVEALGRRCKHRSGCYHQTSAAKCCSYNLCRRQNPESEAARKKAEADRLRAAEKFMVIGTGEATCPGCGYEYRPKNGDSEYPVPPGTLFQARRPLLWQTRRPIALACHCA